MIDKLLLEKCVEIIRSADRAVMKVYNSDDFEVETKADHTPLTKADKLANQIITAELEKISDLPIMSEEGEHNISSQTFWSIDPIDGTKEFIKRNGEFTINIGLVENGEPVLGVVSIPAQNTIYFGAKSLGSYKQVGDNEPRQIKSEFSGSKLVVAVSRSHQNEATERFLSELPDHELITIGSSIKFCLVAEGKAAMFPCLGERHLWDTAAADAILRVAGGRMISLKTGQPIPYDPANLINSNFVAATNNADPKWYNR